MRSECSSNCCCFSTVPQRRRGSMRIQVVDVGGLEVCILQRKLHHPPNTPTVFRRCVSVKRVRVRGVTNKLRQDVCSSVERMFKLFKDEDARTFAHDKPISRSVPGPRRCRGGVIAGGECAHRCEASDRQRRNRCLAATTDHYVSITSFQDAEAFTDRVSARRACRR